MRSIPEDIWRHVGWFIPEYELRHMYSINRAFLQLAMDAIYREVYFVTSGEKSLKRMERLRDNPYIACRVRCLDVDLIDRDYRQVTGDDESARTFRPALDKVIQTMIDTITLLTNVTEFCIQWRHLPAEEHLLPLLTAAWNAFASGLQKLVFAMPLIYLPNLLSTTNAASFRVLRHLDVELRQTLAYPMAPGSEPESVALADALAQFVNGIAPTLRSLSLSSWVCHLGLGFQSLCLQLGNIHIPNLEQFNFHLEDDDATILSEERGLTNFLRNHAATLRHIIWTGNLLVELLVDEVISRDGGSWEQRMLEWLNKHGLDYVFADLLTLQMPLPSSPAGFNSLTVQCIKTSANTLKALTLNGSYLRHADVHTLGSIFQPRQNDHLRELGLQVEYLTPDLMQLLSRMFPRLGKLSLDMHHLALQDGVETNAVNLEEELVVVRKFADDMRKHDFRRWPVHALSIRKRTDFNFDLCIPLMWAVAESVPSVENFYGVFKKLYETQVF